MVFNFVYLRFLTLRIINAGQPSKGNQRYYTMYCVGKNRLPTATGKTRGESARAPSLRNAISGAETAKIDPLVLHSHVAHGSSKTPRRVHGRE